MFLLPKSHYIPSMVNLTDNIWTQSYYTDMTIRVMRGQELQDVVDDFRAPSLTEQIKAEHPQWFS